MLDLDALAAVEAAPTRGVRKAKWRDGMTKGEASGALTALFAAR